VVRLLSIFRRKESETTVPLGKKIVTVEPERRGCALCTYVEVRDGWHIQNNRCKLRGLILGKDITKEDGCDRWQEKEF
jgi:hypothetical protein